MTTLGRQIEKKRVLVFAPSFPPAYLGGGPARTLSALVAAAPPHFDVFVITPAKDTDGSFLDVDDGTWVSVGRAQVYYADTSGITGTWKMLRASQATRPNILYLNSFFNSNYSILPSLLHRLGVWRRATLLIAPRGEFDKGALAIRAFKKKLFIHVSRALRVYSHAVWHASAQLEATSIRDAWTSSADVLVRENETNLPYEAHPPVEDAPHPMRAIFLSRIAPKKGLLMALTALKSNTKPIIFNIYGPEEDKLYAQKCRQVAASLPASVQVVFHGAVSPEEARALFAAHDALFLPTAGENFGHVIAEALSASCIVLCPDTTPWSSVISNAGGEVVHPNTVEQWSNSIKQIQNEPHGQRRDRRIRACAAYNKWRQTPQGIHIFEMLSDHSYTTD